jgi:hypothetical protein
LRRAAGFLYKVQQNLIFDTRATKSDIRYQLKKQQNLSNNRVDVSAEAEAINGCNA